MPEPEDPLNIAVDQNSYCIEDKPANIQLSISNTGDSFRWYQESTDPGNLVGSDPVISIPAPDVTTTYLVRSETSCGESVTETVTVTVFPSPVVAFTVADNCQLSNVAFSDQTTIASGTLNSWSWDFGDGQNSTLPNPNHVYTTYGTFSSSLTVVSDLGCLSQNTQDIIIHPKPDADFSFSEVCFGDVTDYTNLSDGFGSSITNYQWTFNQSEGSSILENPGFTYAAWGLKETVLEVTTEFGCQDTYIQNTLVDSLPIASFTYVNPCRSNVVTFTDASDYNGKIIDTWAWDFGDGNTSTETHPQHIYADAASFYAVNLLLTDTKGCTSSFDIPDVYVNPDFSVSIQSGGFCVGREEILTAHSNDPNIIMDAWEWIVDGVSYSTADQITISFPSPGMHEVHLVGTLVTNGNACTSGDVLDIEVKPLPAPDFTYGVPNLDFPTPFTDASSVTDPGASIISWDWDFGDGTTAHGQNPTHLFSASGDYLVELLVTDDNSCQERITQTVRVNDRPAADFSFDLVCEGEITSFNDLSTTAVGTILSWQWDFGDPSSGGSNTSNLQNPQHFYSNAGTYQVKLIVEAFGFDTITQDVTVYALPQTDFSWSTPCLNEVIQLTDQTLPGDGMLMNWDWDISDGFTSAQQNPQHTFPAIGNYDIKLLTTDEHGCQDSLTQLINIKLPPTSDFTYALNCLNSPTEFTNTSDQGSAPLIGYAWDFGDGQSFYH